MTLHQLTLHQPTPRRPLICHPGDGRKFEVAGMTLIIKAPGGESTAPFTLYEAQIPPHFAALSAHVHYITTEWFYVISGTLAFTLDDETVMARAGSFLAVAPGVVHTFWNPTATAATVLGAQSRPDFAEYLASLSTLLATTSWPPADMTPLHRLAAQYDQFVPGEHYSPASEDGVVPVHGSSQAAM
ncbi:MAG: cupin domain-containing protein [Caldilineaceae bacterium]|nr:cupin domain-containing protein [Caldilineaceae bacterium]